MDNLDINIKVKKAIADQIGLKISEIKDDSNLESLGMDSLDTIECVMDLEDQYAVEIPDENIDEIRTVNDLIILVKKVISNF